MNKNIETITIRDYLDRKVIKYRELNGELITKCLFRNCDADSREDEAHLYFNVETGQYQCKKCLNQGNIFSLAEHLGDKKKDVLLNTKKGGSTPTGARLNPSIVERCNRELPARIRKYLNSRGITDELIKDHYIGFGNFYGKNWITIPVKDEKGDFSFLKLRKDPEDNDNPDKGKVFPFGKEAQIYGWETLKETGDKIVVCEGEFDRLVLLSKNIPAVTSTGGAGTFKKEWLLKFSHINNVYVCYDNDEAGQKGATRVMESFASNERLNLNVFSIVLPEEVGDGGDVTTYFINLNHNPDDFFRLVREYPDRPLIDESKFSPMYSEELIDILGTTIKKDEANKLITFLGELSAFTENSQLNISYIAPSSTGKSYIPMEIAGLFPAKDVITVGYCSPTAFFHDQGKYVPDKDIHLVDLSKKILIFLDQPHTLLLQHLRPLLSHDKKEINIKITDKNQRGGHRTKNILLRGFPAVVFCTAGLKLDEQEATRFLLLSPETNQDKIREGIELKIMKETDSQAYQSWLDSDPRRQLLIQRIQAIKNMEAQDVKIGYPDKITEKFFKDRKTLKPKHQRDIGRIIAIAKCFAILNLWWREDDGVIIVNERDIDEAFKVWARISESQELNIPPYLYNFYYDIILPVWKDKASEKDDKNKVSLKRKDITKKHLDVYGRVLNDWFLRQQVLPVLENSGMISQEADSGDKRCILIYPIAGIPQEDSENYSEQDGGVKNEMDEKLNF